MLDATVSAVRSATAADVRMASNVSWDEDGATGPPDAARRVGFVVLGAFINSSNVSIVPPEEPADGAT